MSDREKVIKQYEDYVNSYISLTTSNDYEFEMHKAVLALLKEQEPVTPISYYHGLDRPFTYRCGHCYHSLKDGDCFCSGCGRGIDWE